MANHYFGNCCSKYYTYFYSSSNIVINFGSAKKLTEINHIFDSTKAPNSIEIYGSNEQDLDISFDCNSS